MKKIICFALSALLAAGCSVTIEPDVTPSAAASAAPAASAATISAAPSAAAATLKDVDKTEQDQILHDAITAYNTVLSEDFGAEFDTSAPLFPLYDTKEEANSFETSSPSAIVPAKELEGMYDGATGEVTSGDYKGKYLCPAIPELYTVTNYKSMKEISDKLDKVMDIDLYAATLSTDFLENQGTLYAVRGGRGYGGTKLDESTLEYDMVTDSGDTWLIMMNKDDIGGTAEQYRLGFENVNGTWKLIDVSSINA